MHSTSRPTQTTEPSPWIEVGLALIPLVPITIAEILNGGHPSPLVLPILLAGVVIGARRGWPLWSLWWLGWTLYVAVFALLFQLSPGRAAIIYTLWPILLTGIAIAAGLSFWQRGDGFRAAFTLFPWALEFTRFVFFDDLSQETGQFLVMRAATSLIYACVVARVVRRRSRRARWLTLSVSTVVYLAVVIIASLPTCTFFIVSLAHLPSLALLAAGPLAIGLGFDGYRARRRLSVPMRVILLVTIISSIISLPLPWITGDATPAPPYAPTAAGLPGPRQAVIVDTDMSFDDYIAILYLLQRSDVDIRGITVVNGVAHIEAGMENAQRLLAMAGREDIPVAAGTPTPSNGENAFPSSLRFILNSAFRPALPKPATASPQTSSSDLISQVVADSSTPVTLIALGPLTNVAQALQDDPSLVSRLDAVIFSGGALYVEGLADPHTMSDWDPLLSPVTVDWNLFVDPYAADVVLQSGVPLVLIPLDVTDQGGASPILISHGFTERFARATHGHESRLMSHIMLGWLLTDSRDAIPAWDVPAAAIAVDPDICTAWRDLSIHITLEPTAAAGEIIIDENGQPNAHVCLAGDQAAFEETFLATVH